MLYAVAFFNLINELHQRTSLIITTNKAPKEWAEVLHDKVLTTALLDRILYRCEIIKLVRKKDISIIRILHKHRDIPNLLK